MAAKNVVKFSISDEQMEMVQRWHKLRRDLDSIKADEARLRQEIVNSVFGDLPEGVYRADLGMDCALKFTSKFTRKIDEEMLANMSREFRDFGICVEDFVTWKPSLDTRMYKRMADDQRVLFDSCVETKRAMGSLDIEVPETK